MRVDIESGSARDDDVFGCEINPLNCASVHNNIYKFIRNHD